jgi:hypothetical protein
MARLGISPDSSSDDAQFHQTPTTSTLSSLKDELCETVSKASSTPVSGPQPLTLANEFDVVSWLRRLHISNMAYVQSSSTAQVQHQNFRSSDQSNIFSYAAPSQT